jgi:tetratricopeptide (TPR) repeat protein
MSNLRNKKCKIIVIDPSAPVRQMLSETIRQALGFESVESMSTIADVLKFLEVDKVDWIITPLSADQPANALHLLKIVSEYPDLKNVRVSLLLDPSESYVIPAAAELGMLSWHKKPTIKDAVKAEIGDLISCLEKFNGNEPMTAAHYLSMHLKESGQFQEQLSLYKNLLQLYPGNGEILLQMAEPFVKINQPQNAARILNQARMVDEKLKNRIDELSQTLLNKTGTQVQTEAAASGEVEDILATDGCVVIDSDSAVGQGVKDLLTPLGVKNITHFTNGEEAWAHLEKNPEPQLIIMEWRVQKVSGPMLLQRIRSHGFFNVPIIILSSLLKPEDMPLLKEMGAANIVQKPLNKDLFVPACIWTIQQDRLPTEHQALERKIRLLLNGKKFDEAEPLKAQFLADPGIPIAKKRLIEAEYAYAKSDFNTARDGAIESLKLSGDSIIVLNLLGKTFMKLRNFEAAVKCFNKADKISPNNIERICNIAESQADLGKQEAAAESMDEAITLDPDSKVVAESQIKVAIAGGDTDAAKRMMSQMNSLDSLVAYMNNKAVTFAKMGETVEAVELYKKTINSIPDELVETKAIVIYNLALAQARDSALEDAIEKLNQVLSMPTNKISQKASSLKERLEKALSSGTEFKLKSDALPKPQAQAESGETTSLANDEEFRQMMASVLAKKGDLCCYLLYHPTAEKDVRVNSLFAKQPRFQKRESIARDESFGAEKVSKQSA